MKTVTLSIFGVLAFVVTIFSFSYLKISEQPSKELGEQEKFQKLSGKYCIEYGNRDAPVHITEFFSFQCAYCIQLFRNDFEKIKEEWIDTGKVHFTFHPVPMDLTTFRALICMERLEEKEKRLFLEVIFEEAEPQDAELMAKFMMTAMNVFEKPVDLTDQEFLHKHPIFHELLPFIQQEKVLAVPAVEINNRLFAKEIPSHSFIKAFIED